MLKFRLVLQKACFVHVSQCRWCTGKACSPSHRFSFPETKLWPSGAESPPAVSRAAEAGWEKGGERGKKVEMEKDSEKEWTEGIKDEEMEGK